MGMVTGEKRMVTSQECSGTWGKALLSRQPRIFHISLPKVPTFLIAAHGVTRTDRS